MTTPPGGLGRRYSPDPRDGQHLLRAALGPTPTLPDYRYYRTGPVLDQAQTSECVGYAWRGFLMAAPLMTKDGPDGLAIYKGACLNDEWTSNDVFDPNAGSSVRGGAKYLQSVGRLSSYLWAFNMDDVERWMLGGKGGLVAGTNWLEGMFDPDPDGRLHLTGNVAGGHAYYLYGINRKKRRVWLQNSWSTSWGFHGRAYITYEDFDILLTQGGEACTAVEVKPAQGA